MGKAFRVVGIVLAVGPAAGFAGLIIRGEPPENWQRRVTERTVDACQHLAAYLKLRSTNEPAFEDEDRLEDDLRSDLGDVGDATGPAMPHSPPTSSTSLGGCHPKRSTT